MRTPSLFYPVFFLIFFLILRRMSKNKAEAPTLPRIRYIHVFRFNPRSRYLGYTQYPTAHPEPAQSMSNQR